MPRLTPQHYKVLVKIFKKADFSISRVEGDHIVMNKPGIDRCLVIPKYSDVGIDIIKANLRSAKISRKEYFRLLADP